MLSIAALISPGSYINTEEYELDCSKDKVINSIKKFKEKNTDFNVPERYNLFDGKGDSNDYWYHVYFYFKEDSTIAHAWVRQVDFEPTIIGLVSIKINSDDYTWKLINKDFSSEQNIYQKRRFEDKIVEPIINDIENN